MKFTIKYYKLQKIKTYFKKFNFFFLANATTSKNENNILKKLKRVDLNFYNVYNSLTKQILKNSSYRNYQFLINNLNIIILPNSKNTIRNYNKDFFDLLSIKLNNKMYIYNDPLLITTYFNYTKNYYLNTKILRIVLRKSKNLNFKLLSK